MTSADDERLSDELFDALGAGHPPEGDRLAAVIDAWRARIVAEPIPGPPTCHDADPRRDGRWVRWWRHQQVRTAWLRGGQL